MLETRERIIATMDRTEYFQIDPFDNRTPYRCLIREMEKNKKEHWRCPLKERGFAPGCKLEASFAENHNNLIYRP